MSITPDSLRETMKDHFSDPAALEVAVSLVNAVTATERVLLQDASRDTAVSVARMLTDFAVNLQSNVFWQQHAGRIMPVFASAVLARMDSYDHALGRGRDRADDIAHVSSRQAIIEVAVFAQFVSSGAADGAMNLRRALIEDIGGLANAR